MTSQQPIDGKFKVTSPFGWRKHPITGVKKHHNGTDYWKSGKVYLEACFAGRVKKVVRSTNPNSFGNYAMIHCTVMGQKVTLLYAHMVDGSIKVAKGQVIEAGTVIGKMGETGFATGPHLHLEIWKGHLSKQPNTNTGGKGFYDPMKFINSAIEWEKTNKEAPEATPADAPVTVAPAHSAPVEPSVAPVAPAAPATPAAPVVAPDRATLKVGSKGSLVKVLQKKLGVTADGDFGPNTKKAVVNFQEKHGLTADGIVGPKTWAALG
jgi:murein DD-endopeptidase MepM/ murein hydrolase activator NlpD